MDGGTSKIGEQTAEASMRGDLAGADAMIDAAGPMLRHLLANDDQSLFGEEIVARVRSMCADLSRQLVFALAEAAGQDDPEDFLSTLSPVLENALHQQAGLLTHIHGLALEWQLGERLQQREGVDPVLPPLLQSLIASPDPATAATAMAFLAAQARFIQQQRRMELPLRELPGDLLYVALLTMRANACDLSDQIISAAENALRDAFDEAATRLGLMARLVVGMGGGAIAALSVMHSGPAIYLTALAQSSGQDRVLTILSASQARLTRHALALRMAGLKPANVRDQLERIGNDASLPQDFDLLSAEQAGALLSDAAAERVG